MIPARLFDEVLALPPEERREFALRVLETIDEPISPDIDEAHYQEVLRRLRLIESGAMTVTPWEQIRDKLLPSDPSQR